MKLYLLKTISIVIAILSVVACTTNYRPIDPVQVVQTNLLAEIQNAGVQVIQQGSQLQLILPTDRFFKLTTTEVQPAQVATLQRIAIYLWHYMQYTIARYPIKIYAYTDRVPDRQNREVLSNQYAQVIASFMWRHGFTPRELRVVGYGASHPIASLSTPAGSAYNRRVVIQVDSR